MSKWDEWGGGDGLLEALFRCHDEEVVENIQLCKKATIKTGGELIF
ncbi:hypothetical protein [Basilea psittacipulmonis]|nr:hypothetical protein [Basilea psittacipulmonis]